MSVMLQPAAALPVPNAWSDAAIRDTIAAMASRSEYQRELTTSLASRALRWLGDLLDAL